MRILIHCPNINAIGGIANHYLGLKPYWNVNVKYIHFVGCCKFNGVFAFIRKTRTLLFTIRFIVILLYFKPDVVLTNVSLVRRGMSVQLFLLQIVSYLRRKTVLFIHGWRVDYEKDFFSSKRFDSLKKADGVLVLANEFKQKLIQNGYKGNIFLTTTKVDDRLIENFNINIRTGKIENILFLARVEKQKGIFETIKTFDILKRKYNGLKLRIVGDGTALRVAKKYVENHTINDVDFIGNTSGEKLVQEFSVADIYLLPTYTEGMPTSLLEAMAFGLPVITRPVGGIIDFFNENMGVITESLDPQVYADAVEQYINDSKKTLATSRYNYEYAKEHFMASKVALSMEQILRKIHNS